MFRKPIVLTVWMLMSLPLMTDAVTIQPEKTIIRLHSEFSAPEATAFITLGHLAKSIEAPDPEQAKKLEKVTILPAPAAGESTRIGKQQVMFEIRKAGFDYHNVLLESENVIPIYGPGHKVTIDLMVEAIHQKIMSELGWSPDELVIRILSIPSQDAWLPGEDYEMHINHLGNSYHGSSRFEAQFYIDNILVSSVPFLVTVQHKRTVYLATREISQGEVLTKDDVREVVQFVENETLDRQLVEKLDELVGQRARSNIHRNSEIKYHLLATNYLLKRGDLVKIIVNQNGMILQTTGIAQLRAAKGDIIPVKTVIGKIIKGRVLSNEFVELVAS